jgi:hypothetical protein
LYKNANLKIAEPVNKHFSKRSQPTSHHCGVIGHIRPHCHQIRHQNPRIKKQEPKIGKSSSKPSMPLHAFRQKQQCSQRGSPSCRHCGKYGHTKVECFRVKPHKPKKNLIYEELVNMMKSVLVRLNNLDMAYNLASQVNEKCLTSQHFFSKFSSNLMCHNPKRLWHISQNDRSHGIVTHQVGTNFFF